MAHWYRSSYCFGPLVLDVEGKQNLVFNPHHVIYNSCRLLLQYLSLFVLSFCLKSFNFHSAAPSLSTSWIEITTSYRFLDYTAKGNAPLRFNVIDTSTIVDPIRPLNILLAASPLLELPHRPVCTPSHREDVRKIYKLGGTNFSVGNWDHVGSVWTLSGGVLDHCNYTSTSYKAVPISCKRKLRGDRCP